LNIDIKHIGEREMSQTLSRAVAAALAMNVVFILWANTLAPIAA